MGKMKLKIRELKSHSEEESDDSDNDSDDEIQKSFSRGELSSLNTVVALQKTRHVNNVNGIKSKINEFKLNYNWIETLDMVNEPLQLAPELEAHYGDLTIKTNRKGEVSGDEFHDKAEHDFKREMLFYRQAQSAAIDGIQRLKMMHVNTKRPDDYFAQMVKGDDHMTKIRENIIHQHTVMESSEKAKKLRHLQKYGKQIQNEVIKKRQKEKREILEKVKSYKKKGKEYHQMDFLDKSSDKKSKGTPTLNKIKNKINPKNEYKKKRFGFGGQKKRSKYNTAESSAEISSFKNSIHGKPKNKSRKGNPQRNSRPGKSKRQMMKGKRKG